MKRTSFIKYILVALLISFFSYNGFCQPYYIQVNSEDELQKLFKWTPDRIPLISAHRGGPMAGFPENCLATFDNILNQAHVLIECDVQLTKDGHLILMHDETLDRTTNSSGKVSEKTLAELKKLLLKDNDGNLTQYNIPTIDEVLTWGKNKTIVQLDVKKGVPPHKVVEAIERNKAYASSLVITYTPEVAQQYYQLNKQVLISATIRNKEELERLQQTGIPKNKLVAFVGLTEPDTALYELLHKQGIYCVLGTLGNLDRRAEARKTNIYEQLIQNGADILATDRPIAVDKVIKEVAPKESEKEQFFYSGPGK